jgi:HEPN domain-containing protein
MVFEGDSDFGAHLIWPQPVMTLAKFAKEADEILSPSVGNELGHCYFREDFFDPVSRIRRGRFYQATGSTKGWNVLPSPNVFMPNRSQSNGMVEMSITDYRIYKLTNNSEELRNLVVLGSGAASSVWSIVGIEAISTGEEMVTIKARQSLGALPDVYWAKIPGAHRHKVQEAIEKLADDYRKAGAESVIDRAREAATAILSAYLQSLGVEKAKGKDLGELVKQLVDHSGQHEQRIVACAAEVAQRLHTRGKHAAKEQFDNLRPIREQDAELAVQSVGVMLCDLRWADWR